MMNPETEIQFKGLKITTVWGAVLSTKILSDMWIAFYSVPWDKLAQFAAFIYTVFLATEFIVKKIRLWRTPNGTDKNLD